MQIEFNGDVYDVNVTSSAPYVEATFHDPAEGGDIEYEISLCDDENKTLNFDKDDLEEIDRMVRNESAKEAKYNADERASEMAEDREDRF